MAGMGEERRSSARYELRRPIAARVGALEVTVRDVAEGGCRVEHRKALPEGQMVTLQIDWEDFPIRLDCTVVRSADRADGSAHESGLMFSSASITALPAFRRMLQTISHQEEIERLRTVVDASKLINSSLDADTLLDSILTVARRELSVDRGTLYFVDRDRKEIWTKIADSLGEEIRLPVGRGIAGTVAATGDAVILHDAYSDSRFDPSSDQRSGYRTRSMLCAPIRNRQHETVGVLQLLNKRHGSFGPRDLEFLDTISDHMAIAMENAKMHLELVEKQRMERELQLGREIQGRLLPAPPSDLKGVEISARNVPCYEVGGDYFDFLEFANGDLGIAIGDVSGKGVSAALVMSSLQAALRVAAPIEPDLSSLIARLNGLLHRMTSGRKYVTFFFGRLSPSSGELRYVNAGHNPPFIVSGDRMDPIPATGKPIGLMPDVPFEEKSVIVPPGATLVLYTDGFNEAANGDDEEFGMERLQEIIRRRSVDAPDLLTSGMLEEVTAFESGAHANDDKTVVAVRRATSS